MEFQNSLATARQLDSENPLRHFREKFLLPPHGGKDAIYFLGNSLGLQPKSVAGALGAVLEQWHSFGVESFFKGNEPWLEFHRKLTPMLAPVVGALPQEVVIMNQLTVNLHLMLVSFYQPSGKRTKILCEAKAFPSDQYMLYTHAKHCGFNPNDVIIEVEPQDGEVLLREEDILAAIDRHKEELALVFWGGVNYYTGQVFNMKAITQAAHAAGAKVGFDLAHAVGNIPLQLHDWDADFACWCSYKYLNSGPGGVGGAFVHERYHHDLSLNRFAGWWGNKKETQFLMEKAFVAEASAEGWQLSTPSPMLYAAHKSALELFQEAGVKQVFDANRHLNEYLWFILKDVQTGLPGQTFRILTPPSREGKGCQVSLAVKNGRQVFDFLADEGVFADWREPDVIRVAPVALYNTFEEVWQFGQLFKTALHKFTL